jgi:hypothetical protein
MPPDQLASLCRKDVRQASVPGGVSGESNKQSYEVAAHVVSLLDKKDFMSFRNDL